MLNHRARGGLYLVAVLLFSTALYFLVPLFDLSHDEFRVALQQANLTGIGLGFLAGFVFSFNPVSFAVIPVVLAYVTKAREERRALLLGGAFVAGMLVTHALLGVIAALGGEWVKAVMGRAWGLFLGPLLILLGLLWPGWLTLRLPWISLRAKRVTGVWGAFLLGIPFSVAVCPFCTPALLVALTASAAIGSVPFGLGLLLAFAAGRSVPIVLGAWSMGWLESLRLLSRYQKVFEMVAGLTLISTGLYLLNEYFFVIKY
ncbi:Cytochrome c-type biogenesis protein CcdA (DsbD analog) [hydrothermal vent metagenome]|uniref:Cytochrome c-type biogenesis protein CcdA (DsbD analog) n=1 Tax=hydrothermal vent metagenome TaxID=652676 RepID=A0A3B0Z5R0_9ZZZZ